MGVHEHESVSVYSKTEKGFVTFVTRHVCHASRKNLLIFKGYFSVRYGRVEINGNSTFFSRIIFQFPNERF